MFAKLPQSSVTELGVLNIISRLIRHLITSACHSQKRTILLTLSALALFSTSPGLAQSDNVFEVGTGTIANTFNPNPQQFTTFDFARDFAQPPLIFVLPSTQGSDECAVRIRNVTVSSFDAYCTEAPPRDGEHVAVNIQYIAIIPGVTTVPTTSGGSVTFEAGSVETQTVQHNCAAAAGCGTEGWDIISPSSVNPSNASILGQVQTMVNESANPPTTNSQPFFSTAIDPSQGAASQFGLALERGEVDEGNVTMDETVAWLAIEDTGGCVTLDFSTLGGPSSVPFQSIVTDDLASGAPGGDIHNAPDGWSNGCNAGEGATFEAACFTNTPVVLAHLRSRNEEESIGLRQCGISTTGLTVTIEEDRSRDNERNHVDEAISVLAFGQAFSTPVTLSYIHIQQIDRKVSFAWETATETLNIGFNLWAKLGNQWIQINKKLIPSNRQDKLQPSNYQHDIRLSAHQRDQITAFGISSVDVSGKDEFFGPFQSGQSYGETAIPEPIDWTAIKQEHDQSLLARGYQFIDGKWRKARTTDSNTQPRIDIQINEPGFYRITYEQLKANGIDWAGQRSRDIAISLQNTAVARLVKANRGRFGAGSWIEFYAVPPQGNNGLYTATNVYQLQLNRGLALPMPKVEHPVENTTDLSRFGFYSTLLGENIIYSELTAEDPWMDAELFAYGSSADKTYVFHINQELPSSDSRIKVQLAGGTDLPGAEQDHHVQLWLNGTLIADSRADGFDRWEVDTRIPADLLQSGENTLRIVAPGDTGFNFDLFYIDRIAILSAMTLSYSSGFPTSFTAPVDTAGFAIALTDSARPERVYISQANGNVALIKKPDLAREDGVDYLLVPTTAMHAELEDLRYWLGSTAQMRAPTIVVTTPGNISIDNSDYLIIAHPAFINEELESFAQSKADMGLTAKIINWFDIVERYGYGIATPQALRNFLTAANLEYSYQYILLVGGHSYDYLDYKGLGAVNFIPSWHRGIDLIQQAPTDTPYADLDGDQLPDKAIGRWPVRTAADLSAIIRKSNEWVLNGLAASRNALFIAEQTEANRDFDLLMENALTPVTKRWSDIDRVYLDEILQTQSASAITDARQSIFDSINSGVGLTVFNGHGSPSSWTFQNLVNWNHLQQLENHGLPTMVLPLACYTTYYQTPTVNSLAHQWLFASQDSPQTTGAVAIHGAMVLGDYRENTLFAERVLNQQLKNNMTLGEAILQTKRQLSPWHQMINNWALLGDPSLKLQP